MYRARTYHCTRMRRCIEQANGLVPSLLCPSWVDCIIATRGYDFRKGQGAKVIDWFNQSKSGDGLMKRNAFALFGAVAVLLTATVALTLSRATLSAGSVGSLKCYNTGGIEKAC
jgi:hypothetical protein